MCWVGVQGLRRGGEGKEKIDLTQMNLIDRHVGLPLSKWRRHGVDFFSLKLACWAFKSCFVSGGIGFSPWGRRERGFPVLHFHPAMPVQNIIPGQIVTKE